MIFALDTNIVSFILRGNSNIRLRIRQEELQGNNVTIPLVTYYEVKRGLFASGATSKLRMFEFLCSDLGVRILNTQDMDAAARIYADNKYKGTPMEDDDIMIAAECVSNAYTLVTNNVKHFERVDGLLFEDWVEQDNV
jgi:predicted nucleic acid-binding protein